MQLQRQEENETATSQRDIVRRQQYTLLVLCLEVHLSKFPHKP